MDTFKDVFDEIRTASQEDKDILGFVVTGSRGKGFANQWSDYDCAVFVREEAIEKFKQQYADVPAGGCLYIFTLETFSARMVWKGLRQWERYTWAHLTVENDRTQGDIQQLLSEASHVPLEHATDHTRQSLRWFVNQTYHSLKNLRAGNIEGHRLEAAECVRPFFEAVFCLHDRRGDYRVQQLLLREAKRVFSEEGFAPLFAWPMSRFCLDYSGESESQLLE